MGQEGDFSFSVDRRPLSLEELQDKLAAFFVSNSEDNELTQVITDPKSLVNKYITHLWTEGGKDIWYKGIVNGWQSETEEYSVQYQNENGEIQPAVYLTVDEIVTDMKNGDLVVLWEE